MPRAGHYAGTTNQGHPISFDVRPDLKNLTLIVGGAVDETCTPAHAWTYPGYETGGFDYEIAGGGKAFFLPSGAGQHKHHRRELHLLLHENHNVCDVERERRDVHGTYDVTTTFTDQGVKYSCSGSTTWTATHS